MKLGILSDTHDCLANIDKAFEVFQNEKVDFLVHCGDWAKLSTLDYFIQKLVDHNLTCKSCFGNNDREILEYFKKQNNIWIYKDLIEFGSKECLTFIENNKKFAVCHGKSQEIFSEFIKDKNIDYLFYGHTHISFFGRLNDKFVMNPGSVIPEAGTDSVGILEIINGEDKAKIVELN